MSDFDRLKHLLFADEREQLLLAKQRIEALEQTHRELAVLLPSLVRAAPHEPMTRALASPVAAALGNAVHENRASIVDALFPVIGPIIRKAIAEALRGLMRDMNQVFEHGLSPRGIRWRIEAWRSGVPFAQIVLKNSLNYRVDHVFLIERGSGLVLHRSSSPGLPDLDADAIAGMLTAIGQFVRDSVSRDGSDSLEAARVGEHLLWVLDGPRATISCFIQGVPPDALRVVLSDRLEQIHAQMAGELLQATGQDSDQASALQAGLDPVELVAASAAMSQRQESATATPGSHWPALLVLVLVLAGLTWYFARVERWNARVDALRATLLAHPGFLLTDLESKTGRSLTISGLLDPDAEAVLPLVEAADLGGVRAQLHTLGYVSTDDAVLAHRARRLLEPPAGVSLDARAGLLLLRGTAEPAWIQANQPRVAWIAGIRSVDWQVMPTDDGSARRIAAHAELNALAASIEQMHVSFVRDIETERASESALDQLAVSLTRVAALSTESGIPVQLVIKGHTDSVGSSDTNRRLRLERAIWLRDRLLDRGVPAGLLQHAETGEIALDPDSMFRGASLHLTVGAIGR